MKHADDGGRWGAMTTTNEVKPYTAEDVENLRRSVNDVRNHPPTPRVVRRLLATLDERTRERDEARADAARGDGLEAMARDEADRMLRSACDLRDALDSVAAVLGVDTSTDADTEARACVAEVAALREEVDRLRKRCAALEAERDTGGAEALKREREAALHVTQEAVRLQDEVAAIARERNLAEVKYADALKQYRKTINDLNEAEEARAAAERRAEEVRAAALEEAARLCDAGAASDQARADDLQSREEYEAAAVWDNSASTFREASRRIRALDTTHPPQQQTPAPADDACTTCGTDQRGRTHLHHEECIEALRSRVRELEERLAYGVTRARWVRDAGRDTPNERSAINGVLEWGGETERWLAALPSQEQPAADHPSRGEEVDCG